MDIFPKDKKKIIERISRYERELKREKQEYGDYDDSYGKRYLLGPLYLLADNISVAIRHYKWFEKEFNDDIDDPIHRLCYLLALYRNNNIDEARIVLMKSMLSNIYMIPHLLGIEQPKLNIRFGSNLEDKEYIDEIPEVIWNLWKKEEISWVKESYFTNNFVNLRNRYIELNRKLDKEPIGKVRTNLLKEIRKLENLENI